MSLHFDVPKHVDGEAGAVCWLHIPVSAELIYTERAHVRMLRVLDMVFYQKLSKEAILPPADVKNIFTNLEEILQLHGT